MGYVENYVMTDVNNPPLKIDPHFFLSNTPNSRILKFWILASFIHINGTAKTDWVANFVKAIYVETCSVYTWCCGKIICVNVGNVDQILLSKPPSDDKLTITGRHVVNSAE